VDGEEKVEEKKSNFNYPLAIVMSIMIICATFLAITIFVSTNPLEIVFKSDKNVVEITDNFKEMSQSIAQSEGDLVVCETKLDLYVKSHGDMWGVN